VSEIEDGRFKSRSWRSLPAADQHSKSNAEAPTPYLNTIPNEAETSCILNLTLVPLCLISRRNTHHELGHKRLAARLLPPGFAGDQPSSVVARKRVQPGPAETASAGIGQGHSLVQCEWSRLHTATGGLRSLLRPALRSAWHSHPLGQVLIVTASSRPGWTSSWGGRVPSRNSHAARCHPDIPAGA